MVNGNSLFVTFLEKFLFPLISFDFSLDLGLRIALGDCQTYHHDLIFLRDVFSVRLELSNELYCFENRGQKRSHWSKIPALYYNYFIRPRNLVNSIVAKELHEQCFQQFLQSKIE